MPTSSPHSDRTKIANLWRFTRFIDYRCFAPPTLDFNPDSDALSRRPYRLLPRQDLIDLFVLKLDGSVFESKAVEENQADGRDDIKDYQVHRDDSNQEEVASMARARFQLSNFFKGRV
uniref:Uncharacterized protein n=1 Tax=Cucumis melo TaxID=3656 RepID=A0A9I9EF33_CUCME